MALFARLPIRVSLCQGVRRFAIFRLPFNPRLASPSPPHYLQSMREDAIITKLFPQANRAPFRHEAKS